jgi:acylphosphatase
MPVNEPISVRVVVHGRVQGVWFRETVRRAAVAAGVGGWARNRADGTVEVLLEGAPDAVERVIDICRQGPPRAEVERVDIAAEQPRGLAGFEVR